MRASRRFCLSVMLLGIVGLAVALSACGGSESPASAGGSPTGSATGAGSSPTATPTASPPPRPPLTADLGNVSCPSRKVAITVHNSSNQAQEYSVLVGDETERTREVDAGGRDRTRVKLPRNRERTIAVVWNDQPFVSAKRTAQCRASPEPSDDDELPYTGPEDTLYPRILTGIGIVITGGVIYWYGRIWPSRRMY